MTSCAFCDGPAETIVSEDEHAWVLVHPDWSPRGHLMIVAKRHVENVSGVTESEWLQIARTWHRVERVLLELTGAERAIVMKLGIQTPHLHIHLYPMRATDDRATVFAAIEGRAGAGVDAQFIANLTRALQRPAG